LALLSKDISGVWVVGYGAAVAPLWRIQFVPGPKQRRWSRRLRAARRSQLIDSNRPLLRYTVNLDTPAHSADRRLPSTPLIEAHPSSCLLWWSSDQLCRQKQRKPPSKITCHSKTWLLYQSVAGRYVQYSGWLFQL